MPFKYFPIFLGILTAYLTFMAFVNLNNKYIFQPKSPNPTLNTVTNSLVQTHKPEINTASYTFEELQTLIDSSNGTYGLYIENQATGEILTHNSATQLFGASLYKVPIAIAIYDAIADNKLSLTTEITYTPADFYDGSGHIAESPYDTIYTVEELLTRLLKDSDNVAQAMLTRYLSEVETNNYLYALAQKMDLPTDSFNTNTYSPADYAKILKFLYENKKYAPIIELMQETAFDDRIQLGFPANTSLIFAHKIGSFGDTGSWHDCGIALNSAQPDNPTFVCLMSENTEYETFLVIAHQVGEFISTQ